MSSALTYFAIHNLLPNAPAVVCGLIAVAVLRRSLDLAVFLLGLGVGGSEWLGVVLTAYNFDSARIFAFAQDHVWDPIAAGTLGGILLYFLFDVGGSARLVGVVGTTTVIALATAVSAHALSTAIIGDGLFGVAWGLFVWMSTWILERQSGNPKTGESTSPGESTSRAARRRHRRQLPTNLTASEPTHSANHTTTRSGSEVDRRGRKSLAENQITPDESQRHS